MAESDAGSLESTPTWAVAIVCSMLIIAALSIEHALHLLTLVFGKKKRKALNQALNHIQTELTNLGFMSLLLTVAGQPISKICIPRSFLKSFLPCKNHDQPKFDEEQTCQDMGKVSLVSQVGTQELQTLIFVLAVFHVLSCLATLGLAEAKMKKWKNWEEETRSVEYTLSNDPRRLKLARQTSFGKRHLNFWSNYRPLLWLACCFRQFAKSVSKEDYFALRRGFLTAHFNTDANYDFHKFLKRSLDHDFVKVVRISIWSWMYAVLFILFNADGSYNHYWSPVIPLMILVIVGMKLEVIITTMCKRSSKGVVAPGTVLVKPDNRLFWFGRPQLLVHVIQFILIQNSFHLAFFTWAWYHFGFRSCFHSTTQENVLGIGIGVLVQFLCAYITLPLYALVAQMGSSMKEPIFADHVIQGLKNWQRIAKRNLTDPSRELSHSHSWTSCEETSFAMPISVPAVKLKSSTSSRKYFSSLIRGETSSSSSSSKMGRARAQNNKLAVERNSSTPPTDPSSSRASNMQQQQMPRSLPQFKYPSGRLELIEVQRVVEEIIQGGGNSTIPTGEFSFRLWKKQGSERSTRSQR
ncbi:MLO-like protein 12 [Iris pallida]|uniref:MLO-like protein n=1 Tax=Iris pallida TaxID=29817 RepID=A0AAX6DNX3_IRIPA|nr:MLO-like protein 12 [Iris pallida]